MAVPPTVKLTVSEAAVEPVRVTVNCPLFDGSPASASLAVMVTVGGGGGGTLSVMVTVALAVEPTV